MYTEEDLRATFGALEGEAPDTAGVLAGVERARRRRTTYRRTAGMVAAAVLAAVVAGGSIIVTSQDPTPPTGEKSNPHRELLSFPFEVDDIPGFAVAYRFVNFQGHSTARIGPPADFSVTDVNMYTLEVFEKGRYDPTADQSGEPVQVNGKQGFYNTGMRCQCSSDTGIPGVVWEYAPDSWALVQYQLPAAAPGSTPPADVREVLMRVANAVRFDRRAPIPVPFRIGYLPEGLRPGANPGDVNTVVRGSLGTMIGLVGDGDRRLFIGGGEMFGRGGELMIEGDHNETVMVDLPQGSGVQLTGTGYSKAELQKIADSITPAPDLFDPTTWFPATEAIPLR